MDTRIRIALPIDASTPHDVIALSVESWSDLTMQLTRALYQAQDRVQRASVEAWVAACVVWRPDAPPSRWLRSEPVWAAFEQWAVGQRLPIPLRRTGMGVLKQILGISKLETRGYAIEIRGLTIP